MSAIFVDNKCIDGKEHKKFKKIFSAHHRNSGYSLYKCTGCSFTVQLKCMGINPNDLPTEFPNMAALLTYQQKIN